MAKNGLVFNLLNSNTVKIPNNDIDNILQLNKFL